MIIATKDKSHRRVSQIFFPVNNNHDNVLSSKMEFEFHRVVVNIFPHTHAHTYIYVERIRVLQNARSHWNQSS